MELSKRKYSKLEVEKLLNDLCREKDTQINENLSRIRELVEDNKNLNAQIEVYKSKETEINKAIIDAENYSKKIKEDADLEYKLVLQSVMEFIKKWEFFIELIKKKYPLYSSINDSVKIKEKIREIVYGTEKVKDKFEKTNKVIDNNDGTFNPKEKIKEYISATSDSGFSLEEVLNPGKLELEDLCKELGLLEEES